MNHKLQKAINNNNGLYQAIFNNHKIQFHITDEIAYTEERVPPYYSNLVTRSKDWRPESIFETINRNDLKENWGGWSIKDSFKVLDLTAYGFRNLFDAQWIYLEKNNFKPHETNGLRYEIIKTEEDLSKWRTAWDSNVEVGKAVFGPNLLSDPNIYFIAGYDQDQIVTGCVINKTDDVLGISNFYAPDSSVEYWANAVSFILTNIEQKDLVGYEREQLTNELKAIGFEVLGNLRVWLK